MAVDSYQSSCLVEVIRARAALSPARIAFTGLTFTTRGDRRTERQLTIGELDRQAIAIARTLRSRVAAGERAILLYRNGIDFAVGFVACLYAGVIAVPAPLPRQGIGRERLMAICADASPRIVLCASDSAALIRATGGLEHLEQVCTDDLETDAAAGAFEIAIASQDIALLQYSSGTTGTPKGVAITHANLVHQARVICAALKPREDDASVSWLPMYHDMGLMTGLLMPLYVGLHGWMMAPDAFVARPLRWLKCISDVRAAYCVAPDFAYALCADRVNDDELRDLDLSHLRYAVNGAEPVRPSTIEAFSRKFERCGFSGNAFYPAYGLAEGTLLVSGADGGPRVRVLAHGSDPAVPTRPVALVSSGRPILDIDVCIVDVETLVECPQGTSGEIWVRGGSVAAGYWRRDALTGESFGAHRADGSGPWLRTGDMGVLEENELYVRGRVKDVIKVRGEGVHPEDIEAALAQACPGLTGGIAAFSVDDGLTERVVVVQEIGRGSARRVDPRQALDALLIHAARNGLVQVDEIVLVERSLPRTTSGKIMRAEVRAQYLGDVFVAAASWRRSDDVADDDVAYHLKWIARHLEHATGRRVAATARFREAGVDTAIHRGLIQRLQTLLGVQAPHSDLMAYQSSAELAAHLAERYGRGEAPGTGGRSRMSAEQLRLAPTEATMRAAEEPIAIIGVACRFAGADSAETFWKNLCEGVESVGEVPPERWASERLFDPNPLSTGKMSTRYGGFLDGIDQFDRNFFGMSARESSSTDPAHRILMELGWEVLEDAGIPAASLDGAKAGVYVGISGCDYSHLQFSDDTLADAYSGLGCALTNAASRVSYLFNLRGPALAIDAACSSSLSALHTAAGAIRSGEISMAFVGGVNVILAPSVTMALSKAGMMAPDGRCKTFDARANGYVRGEGAGFVLLKPLSSAIADGNRVYAVVRGSASNQDGKSSSLSAPNGEAQQRVVMEACARAGVSPAEYTFVEAHGTGTPIGDPIELNALGEVFRIGEPPLRPVRVGSVKTNIGHAESAAGIASVIKTALALHHRTLPGSLNFETPNPLIRFDAYPIEVPTRTEALPDDVMLPLAGVNGFGIGGTNVHVVMQAAPEHDAPCERGKSALPAWTFAVSARSEPALRNNLAALASYVEARPDLEPLDLAATLACARDQMEIRAVVCTGDRSAALGAMRAYAESGSDGSVVNGRTGQEPRIAFVYAGQGSQWWAMGRGLYASQDAFRAGIDDCAAHLDPLTGWSLVEALHADEQNCRLDETRYAQPALFALQHALGRHLASLGLHPAAVVGHSLGEIAAAEAAGIISLEDACRLVAVRAGLMQEITGSGSMASVELSSVDLLAEIGPYGDRLSVAASNAPSTSVISGETTAVDEVLAALARRGVPALRLGVNYAFHSAQTEPLLERFGNAIPNNHGEAAIPFYSTVEGRSMARLPEGYWQRNIRETVRFREAVEAMAGDSINVFLEISPSSVLTGALNRTLAALSRKCAVVPTLQRNVPDETAVARALATLYCAGAYEWRHVVASNVVLRDLPRYQWDRQRYWLDGPHRQMRDRYSAHPLVAYRVPVSEAIWEAYPDVNAHPWLAGAKLDGRREIPLAACIELAIDAGSSALPAATVTALHAVRIAQGSMERPSTVLQTHVHTDARDGTHVRICEHADNRSGKLGGWEAIFDASLEVHVPGEGSVRRVLGKRSVSGSADSIAKADLYRALEELGLHCEPSRQSVARCWRGGQGLLAELELGLVADGNAFHVPYAIVDAVEQVARLAAEAHSVLRPSAVGAIQLGVGIANARFVSCRMRSEGGTDAPWVVDAWVLDQDGAVLAVFDGLELAEDTRSTRGRISRDAADWRCEVEWCEDTPEARTAGGEARGWVLLADRAGVAARAGEALRAAGQRVALVDDDCAGHPAREQVQSFADRLRTALESVGGESDDVHGIVDFSPLGDGREGGLAEDGPGEQDFAVAFRTLQVVQVANAVESRIAPRLWTVTRGARAVVAGDHCDNLLQSMAWGASRSILIEHRELRCTCVDLDGNGQDVQRLVQDLLQDSDDDQIAYRGAARYVGTLRYDPAAPRGQGRPEAGRVALALQYGPDLTLATSSVRRPWPGVGQVLVRVSHAEVGRVDGATMGSGSPWVPVMRLCVGTVESAGAGAGGLVAGTRVVLVCNAPLSTHVTVDARLACEVDAAIDPAQLAVLRPALHALLALRSHGGIQRGDAVLIRDEDGQGVVAAQVARQMGARVYALTMPTLRHAYEQLRIAGTFDLLDPGTDANVRDALQGGAGLMLDVSGGWISQGAGSVRPFGRIASLAASRPSMHRPPANVSVDAVDLDAVIAQAPAHLGPMLAELTALAVKGAFAAPHGSVARGACLDPASISTIEPLVIEIPEFAQVRSGGDVIVADATYLITGGLGGLGLKVAERLVRAGARHLVLVGRSPPGLRAMDHIADLEQLGADVRTRRVDVADAAEVAALIREIGEDMPPLRGVIHAAGVLDNKLSMQMDFDQFLAVMPSKVSGAWHLHRHTQGCDLDFFISFSSLASMLGSPGQANYAAANAFLESLAHHRAASGQVGLTVAWGPWDEVGMAANEHNLARLADHGIGVVALESGLDLVETIINERSGGVVGALPMDWETWARGRQQLAGSAYFASVVPESARAAIMGQRIEAKDLAGHPASEQVSMIRDAIVAAVAGTMRLDPASIDTEVPLASIGLDSIVALELKERVEGQLDLVVRTSSLIGGQSISAMANEFRTELLARSAAADATETTRAALPLDPPAADGLAELSLEEIEALLSELDADERKDPIT